MNNEGITCYSDLPAGMPEQRDLHRAKSMQLSRKLFRTAVPIREQAVLESAAAGY
jgi:hypothetical protein